MSQTLSVESLLRPESGGGQRLLCFTVGKLLIDTKPLLQLLRCYRDHVSRLCRSERNRVSRGGTPITVSRVGARASVVAEPPATDTYRGYCFMFCCVGHGAGIRTYGSSGDEGELDMEWLQAH